MNKKRIIAVVSVFLVFLGLSIFASRLDTDPTIRIGVRSVPTSFDPGFIASGVEGDLFSLFYETLFSVELTESGPKLSLQLISEAPAVISEGKAFRFKLQKKLFQSSSLLEFQKRAVTVQDVFASLLHTALINPSDKILFELNQIQGLQAWLKLSPKERLKQRPAGLVELSENEFEIQLEHANPTWFFVLAQTCFSIVPHEVLADPNLLQAGPIGTGIYRLQAVNQSLLQAVHLKTTHKIEFIYQPAVSFESVKRYKLDGWEVVEPTDNRLFANLYSEAVEKYNLQVKKTLPFERSFIVVNEFSKKISKSGREKLKKMLTNRLPNLIQSPLTSQASGLFFPVPFSSESEPSAESAVDPSDFTGPLKIALPQIPAAEIFWTDIQMFFRDRKIEVLPLFVPIDQFVKAQVPKEADLYFSFYLYDSLDNTYYLNWLRSIDPEIRHKSDLGSQNLALDFERLKALDGALSSTDYVIPLGGFNRVFFFNSWLNGFESRLNRVHYDKLSLNVAQRLRFKE